MDNIVKYNSILCKYIIIGSLIVGITVIAYNIYEESIYWKKYYNKKEHFSQVALEKKFGFYDDYRNYINGKHYLDRLHINREKKDGDSLYATRHMPYKIDTSCFSDEYMDCMYQKGHAISNKIENNRDSDSNYFPVGFDISSRECQENSIDSCVV